MKKIFLVLTLTLLACDAPRQNPLDPGADNYLRQSLTEIKVQRLYPPNPVLKDVVVTEDKLGFYGKTGSEGIVQWYHPPSDSIHLAIFRDGYYTQTGSYPGSDDYMLINIYLNAMPVISNVSLYSVYNNTDSKTYIVAEALVTDPDGMTDIDDIYIDVPEKNFKISIPHVAESDDMYSVKIKSDDISLGLTPETIPELNFGLTVRNLNGDSLQSLGYNIRRVINKTLTLKLPNVDRPESGDIRFTWTKLDLPYTHHYRIILFRLQNPVIKIGTFDEIQSDNDQYILNDPVILAGITDGWYLWTLEVEDQIGNICQSQAVSFQYFK
ncbi:MAG: hypothetical protein AB7T22_06605 [Calditrichaceae bacterium]